jgi:MscS family membrane protein
MPGIKESLKILTSPYINAFLSIFLLVVFAKIVDIIINKVFRRFAKFTKSNIDDRIIDAIHRPIYLTIILMGCAIIITRLKASPDVVFYINNALYSAVSIVWAITIMKISNAITEHVIYKGPDVMGLSRDIIPLIENLLKIVIIAAALMTVLSIWEINITPLLASAGVVGVAIAIAAKDMLSNFFGGISIFMDRPYKLGDYIVLESGERGEVVTIGVRSTRIKTRDDILIAVPNAVIANSKIINESAPIPNFRVRIHVSVSYGSDIDLVERTLLEIASNNRNILSEPAPRVRFREFGDSALNFELLCWAREPALRGRTIHELNSSIYKKFNETGIIIPFPQRDVHIYHK